MSNAAPEAEKMSRKQQILQALAHMLEVHPGELITTAGLAKEVGVSEAALYRHFPSKYKMYESLIEFIEEAVFSRISRILDEDMPAAARCEKILWLVLSFAEKNPGLARLLYGDALAGERDKLRMRVMQFFDRLNTQFRQIFREAEVRENLRMVAPASLSAALLVAVLDGKISQYARSSFREMPTQGWKEQWQLLQAGIFAERKSAFHS
ncbi:MAG: nucleoid occlusion factor SlmA [Cellvibrionales bacterium]|jgi:TetR/AcrR family transcriptional regulator|nr:nucleoid occlusion factor SlmA [Cellvibrionales bacterium]